MAGDWIKVEKATATKPEVLQLADILSIHPAHAFGLCVQFWFWCDSQLDSCHAVRVTNVTLDYVIGHAGFADALIKVGWLRVRDGSLEIPNFDRHLAASAKSRALSAERQRSKRAANVTLLSRSERDAGVTREEKRREENTQNSNLNSELITPIGQTVRLPDAFVSDEVKQSLQRWWSVVPPNPISVEHLLTRLAGEQWTQAKLLRALTKAIEGGWKVLHDPDTPPRRPAAAKDYS